MRRTETPHLSSLLQGISREVDAVSSSGGGARWTEEAEALQAEDRRVRRVSEWIISWVLQSFSRLFELQRLLFQTHVALKF